MVRMLSGKCLLFVNSIILVFVGIYYQFSLAQMGPDNVKHRLQRLRGLNS